MKKLSINRIIIGFAMLVCCGMCGYGQISTLSPVLLSYDGRGMHGRERMPSFTTIIIPSVFYSPVPRSLCFISEANLADLPIEISESEADEHVWLQEYISIEPDKATTLDIDFLPSGRYVITVWIGGVAYAGTFEID